MSSRSGDEIQAGGGTTTVKQLSYAIGNGTQGGRQVPVPGLVQLRLRPPAPVLEVCSGETRASLTLRVSMLAGTRIRTREPQALSTESDIGVSRGQGLLIQAAVFIDTVGAAGLQVFQVCNLTGWPGYFDVVGLLELAQAERQGKLDG